MPFQSGPYPFTEAGINAINEIGGVYGLSGKFAILYVGKANDLRRRLKEHFNNPPAVGITHFYAEAHTTEAARTQREYALIQEFRPVGNTLLK